MTSTLNDPVARATTTDHDGSVAGALPGVPFRVEPATCRALAESAAGLGVDAPAFLLAAVLATQFRHTRRENTEIRTVPGQDRVIPVTVSGDRPFADLARDVHAALVHGPTAQPADDGTREDAGPHRAVERILFSWSATPHRSPAAGGTAPGTIVDVLAEEAGPLSGTLLPTDLPTGADAPGWASALLTLLADAMARPQARVEQLALLPEAGQAETAATANAHHERYPGLQPLHTAFEDAVRRDPHAVAVEAGGRSTTYGELDGRANLLAAALAGTGVRPGTLVGVCVERSAELVVALLAVLKCGAAFVPLVPALPIERVRVVTADAQVHAVVVDEAQHTRLAALSVPLVTVPTEGRTPHPPKTEVTLDHAAYAYYTSGSTGTPKGVLIDHRCAAGRLAWLGRRYELSPGDRVVHKTPLIFDVAIWELFGPLAAGATILMADPGAESDVVHLSELLATPRTVFVHFVPSLLNAYLDLAPRTPAPDLRWVQLSGEAAGTHLLQRFTERFDAELHNLYGQTETSEVAGWEGRSCTGTGGLPLGRQIGLYRLFVLDDDLRPVPPGVPAELCVSGVGGLARGYLGHPAPTAERFVPHPYPVEPGERLYRTGDLVATGRDGQIHYLGRVDDQIKIRGCRVETGEVEAVLAGHPDVRACAVAVFRDEDGAAQLAAYVVADTEDVEDLAAHMGRRLPGYMLPAVYVRLDALPHTPSGKLDRLRLPVPTPADQQVRAGTDKPHPGLEQEIAGLWQSVLGTDRIARTDNFFAVGGNSLKSLQLLNRINAGFTVRVSVRDFFAEPTIEALAAAVEKALVELVAGLSDEEAATLLSRM